MRLSFLLFGVLLSGKISAQISALPDRDYLRSFYLDSKHIVTSPSQWDGDDIALGIFLGGSGIISYTLDREANDWSQRMRSSSSETFFRFIEPFGNGLYVVPATICIYSVAVLSDNLRLKNFALTSLKTYFITGGVVQAVKLLTGRPRPYQLNDETLWFRGFDYRSFPSGHTATAFSIARVVDHFSKNYWVDALAYSMAAMVGFSRMHDNRHWFSDVFFGACIGLFISDTIVKSESKREEQKVKKF